jgi:hypothetical protein
VFNRPPAQRLDRDSRQPPRLRICALAFGCLGCLGLIVVAACNAPSVRGHSGVPTDFDSAAAHPLPASPPAHQSSPRTAASASTAAARTVPPTRRASSGPPAGASASAPSFVATTSGVTAAELGASWHAGCPVGPAQLRQITLTYWGFDGAQHTGKIVVEASVVPGVIKVFTTLYQERFPIRRMQPVSEFGGSDEASMAVDNTSAFNCRYAVSPGKPQWSAHAYGKAIDVNTVENPYLVGGKVLPPKGAAFLKRTPYRSGMAVAGGQLVKAFAAAGWQWGGRWTGSPDYQHFSSTAG